MRVYTGRGDEGQTDLRDASRVSKANPRIEAYGTVDEVNALVGAVRPTGHDDLDERLRAIQNHLHVVQADLANPDPEPDDPTVEARHAERLEAWMDEYDEELAPPEGFVLPGGSDSGAALHHARTVCRRAERRVVALAEAAAESESESGSGSGSGADSPSDSGQVSEPVRVYLNRLSDVLFVFARVANERDGVAEEHPTY